MGSGASSNQTRVFYPIRPLPTQDPLRQKASQTQRRNSSSPTSSTSLRKTHRKPKMQELEWPLPPTDFEDEFVPVWSSDPDRYSIKKAYNVKASSNTNKIKVSDERKGNKEFHQKETSTTQWNIENSSINNSAHVQSSLRTQSHACINLSTTQEIDTLLAQLREVHAQFDLNVEQRGKIISEQSKLIIDLIINDTRDVQQNLLVFAKQRQTAQDKLYNEWLQKYVVELDKWKSKCLAELQAELQPYHRDIMTQSQQLITMVNIEANNLRDELLKMEQAKASTATQEIIDKIQTMSTHQLGTETMTKINLIIHGNVGTKAPGQACVFDFEQSDTDSNKHSGSKTNQTIRQGSTKANGATSIKTVKNSTKEAISTQQKKTTGKTTTVSENYDENMNEEDDQ